MIMASMVMPENSSCLDLTISVPGFPSSPSPSSGGGKMMKLKKRMMTTRRDLDINKVPSSDDREDQFTDQSMEEIDHLEESPPPPPPSTLPLPTKKLKLTKDQSRVLEQTFRQDQTLNLKQKEELALQLRLKPRQVEVWFQNRRARSKLKQTEVECVYLKRWFESLKEQNKKLQKEVEELRSIKASQATGSAPPSTLTMCTRCERATTNAATSATVSSNSDKDTSLPFLRPRHSSASC